MLLHRFGGTVGSPRVFHAEAEVLHVGSLVTANCVYAMLVSHTSATYIELQPKRQQPRYRSSAGSSTGVLLELVQIPLVGSAAFCNQVSVHFCFQNVVLILLACVVLELLF